MFFVEIFLKFFIGFEIFEEICFKFFIDHGAKEEARRPGVQGGLPYALSGYRRASRCCGKPGFSSSTSGEGRSGRGRRLNPERRRWWHGEEHGRQHRQGPLCR